MKASSQHAPEYKLMCGLLRQWREEAGLSQRELAKKMAMAHSIIAKIEIADRRIDPFDLIDWCRATNVDLSVAIKAIERLRKPVA